MKNPKIIAGFAVFGFLLSFISGLFSNSGIGHIILLAFIFALVFAVLGFGLQYVFDEVLGFSNEDGEIVTPSSPKEAPQKSSGHVVDLTIQDEEIPLQDNDSKFIVGSSRQMLSDADLKEIPKQNTNKAASPSKVEAPSSESLQNEPVSETKSPSSQSKSTSETTKTSMDDDEDALDVDFAQSIGEGSAKPSSTPEPKQESFKPVSLNDKGFTSKDEEIEEIPVVEESPSQSDDAQVLGSSMDEELGTLPDLEDVTGHSDNPLAAIEEEESSESSPSSHSTSSPSKSSSSNNVTESQDAALMAKAISSVLARES